MTAFLEPYYHNALSTRAKCYDCSAEYEFPIFTPGALFDIPPCPECASEHVEVFEQDTWTSVWCRLSAPGYLDCTDWLGPYPNVYRAARDLSRTYDCHPRTGKALEY